MARQKLQGRIHYEEDWNGHGEHFVFETKWPDEKEWGLDTAFPIVNDNIHYTALTKVREWQKLGIEFWFGK